LTSAPTAEALKKTQDAWKDVLLAWRRTQPYVHGPIADLGVYGRIQFWPSRRQSVDRVLRAPRPIDEAYIQELGANAVGLSALEIMLFDTRQDEAARLASFTGPQGERQRNTPRSRASWSGRRGSSSVLAGTVGIHGDVGAGGRSSSTSSSATCSGRSRPRTGPLACRSTSNTSRRRCPGSSRAGCPAHRSRACSPCWKARRRYSPAAGTAWTTTRQPETPDRAPC
jgi:hypothetical protein